MLIASALLIFAAACAASPADEGRAHMSGQRYLEAAASFERALQAEPGSTELLLDLGWAYQHAGRLEDARRTYATLMKLDPGNPLYLRLAAGVEFAAKDYDRARALARQALVNDPGDREAALVLARALARRDMLTAAIRILEKSVEPGSIDHAYGRKLARLYEPAIPAETPRALAVVRRLRRSPRFSSVPQIAIHEARLIGELGRHESALRSLSSARKRLGFSRRDPKLPASQDPWVEAKVLEGTLWSRAGHAGRAAEIFQSLEEDGVEPPRRAAAEPRGPGVGSEVESFSDNYSNSVSRATLKGGAPVGRSELRGWVSAMRYHEEESGRPAIGGREGGVGWRFIGSKAEGELELSRAGFSGGAEGSSNEHLVGLSYMVHPALRARLTDSYRRIDTARAVRAARRYRSDTVSLDWSPAIDWNGSFGLDLSRFNDGNSSHEFRVQAMRRFPNRLSAGYAFRHGDSERAEPDYWTPRRLEQHMALFAAEQPFGRVIGGTPAGLAALHYGAGYGVQEQRGRLVQSARLLLDWRLSGFWSLSFDAQYSKTPGYTSRRINGGISLRY